MAKKLKLLDLVENKVIKKHIKLMLWGAVGVLIFLIVILLGFIFIPSVSWGWLDRNTMISSISSIIGGFIGFAGAILAVIGTYGAFYLQVKKEKDERLYKSYQAMYYMINNSIQKTAKITNTIVEEYYKLTRYENNKCLTRDIDKDLKFLSETNFDEPSDILFQLGCCPGGDKFQWARYKEFKENLIKEIEKVDYSELVYDDNWYNYIIELPEIYIGEMTEWINILKFNKLDTFEEFLRYRNIMIADVATIYQTNYIRKQNVSNLASDIAHNYRNIYIRVKDSYEKNQARNY